MARRQRRKLELGEAVSVDSILTILTVLLVLRMVFLVPMVNLDKARTEDARRDSLWIHVTQSLSKLSVPVQESPYKSVLNLTQAKIRSVDSAGSVFWLEALQPDSSLVIFRHDKTTDRFGTFTVQSSSEAPVFRHGKLLWSPTDNQWFAIADHIDYGQDSSSQILLRSYRAQHSSKDSR